MSRRFQDTGRKANLGRAGLLSQFVIFFGIISIMWLLNRYLKNPQNYSNLSKYLAIDFDNKKGPTENYLLNEYIPSKANQVLQKNEFFSIGLNEQKQGVWFAQELWADQWDTLFTSEQKPDFKRRAPSGFNNVLLGSPSDLNFSQESLEACFKTENHSIIHQELQANCWTRMDTLGQFWTKVNGHLYTVSGVIQAKDSSLPSHFYKVYLDYEEPEVKGIAFLFNNNGAPQNIETAALSIQALENKTGINFFPELSEEEERILEHQFDMKKWPLL